MIELPRALAPWASELGVFEPEIAAGLGTLVLRLSAAIGSLSEGASDTRDDPDGLHDLARRGPYERLLASEWLLADEMPDEFLRRAAANEHMFLDLAFRRPSVRRATTVLFDAGPFQLGSPRVAHIALLIVLARRAAAADAEFHWGTLQDSAGPMFTGVTQTSVLSLLAAKTTREPDDTMIDRWRERLDDVAPAERRDAWIVGGPSVVDHARRLGASPVRVDDVLEPGVRSVSVEVRAVRQSPAKRVVLDLPEPNLVARLLRDPFAAAVATRVDVSKTVSLPSSIVLAPYGRFAFVRAGSSVVSFPIPNSARAGVGKPKLVRANGPIAAVGTHCKARACVWGDPETRRLWISTGKGAAHNAGHFTTELGVHAPWMPANEEPLRPLLRRSWEGEDFLYVDKRRWLFQLGRSEGANARLLARDVLAMTRFDRGVAVLTCEISRSWLRDAPKGPALLLLSSGGNYEIEALEATNITDARLAADLPKQDHGIASAIRRGSTWYVHANGRPFEVGDVEGDLVVGLAGVADDKGLVVLRRDRSKFVRHSRAGADAVVDSPSPVVDAALDDRGNMLAFSTEAGELVFYSIWRSEIVGRFQLGVAP